ncbi:MAG: sel1 repeat family protein [Deltaproteobacteria bacterium]|nr:sel1 repeat family protein [Deltaproteobacteria bacterium]
MLSISSSSTSVVDGRVVEATHTDVVAIVGGAVALLAGLALVVLAARRSSARGPVGVALAVICLGLGAYQLIGGLGLLRGGAPAAVVVQSDEAPPPRPPEWTCSSDAVDPSQCAIGCERDADDGACGILVRYYAAAGTRDRERLLHFATVACDRGDAVACGDLGAIALDPELSGAPPDRERALSYYQRACDGGALTRCVAIVAGTPRGALDDAAADALLERGCAGDRRATCREDGYEARRAGNLVGAYRLFSWLCRRGDGDGCNELGRIQVLDGDLHDPDAALRSYARACELSSRFGCVNLAIKRLEAEPPDLEAARRALADACASGDDAIDCRQIALDAERELTRREIWLAQCERRADVDACNEAAVVFYAAEDASLRDRARARELFAAACEAQLPLACVNAAVTHIDVDAAPVDPARAEALFERGCRARPHADQPCFSAALKAGAHGQPAVRLRLMRLACDELAEGDACAEMPFVTRRDGATDAELLVPMSRKACDLRSGLGCKNLAVSYEYGEHGLEKDGARALELYARACELGNGDGCHAVGDFARRGLGGHEVDVEAARVAFGRGCELSHQASCDALAKLDPPATVEAPATP